jgi:hypothetical protein
MDIHIFKHSLIITITWLITAIAQTTTINNKLNIANRAAYKAKQ